MTPQKTSPIFMHPRRLAGAAVLAFCIAIPAAANIGLPVSLSLDSAGSLQTGQPLTVTVTLEPAANLPHAAFELLPSAYWQVLDGTSRFAGALRQGETVELRFRAVPLSDRPEPLRGSLQAHGYGARMAELDPERLGGRFPEQGRGGGSEFVPGSNTAAPVLVFEPGVALPEPLPPTQPRVPGQPAQSLPPVAAGVSANKTGRNASVVIVANGRFTYRDDAQVVHGVRNATVQLYDRNPVPPDTLCASGITDEDGDFILNALCGDFSDGPDLFVRIVLNNSFVEVRPASLFAGSYTFETQAINNFAGGVANFGAININQNRQAFQTHNILMRSHAYMQAYEAPLPKVVALWPSIGTFYTPGVNTISIDSPLPFSEEGDIIHEFGHHVLWSRAESPVPNYSNGICDDFPLPGHCIYSPEEGAVSWTEGWPDFFAAVVHSQYNSVEQWGATRYNFEQREDTSDYPGQEDRIEGVIAAILWDLVDTPSDDQFDTGAGRRDDIDLTFTLIWNVIRNYDPSAGLAHNHPTSIHELWDGLREFHPTMTNRIAEVYREHGIVKPQPDLEVSSTGTAPSRIGRGESFSLANSIRNNGTDGANSGSLVSFRLVRKGVFPTEVVLGARAVPLNLNVGATSSANTGLTVPSTTATGSWLMMVCSDSTGSVPESSEVNNCRSAGLVVVE